MDHSNLNNSSVDNNEGNDKNIMISLKKDL